ncbi:MAG: hypothetical protein AAFU60_17605, partial [Bacteroidota bacterium]
MKNRVLALLLGIIICLYGPVSYSQGPGNGPFLDIEFDRICLVDSVAPDTLTHFWRYTQANTPGDFT